MKIREHNKMKYFAKASASGVQKDTPAFWGPPPKRGFDPRPPFINPRRVSAASGTLFSPHSRKLSHGFILLCALKRNASPQSGREGEASLYSATSSRLLRATDEPQLDLALPTEGAAKPSFAWLRSKTESFAESKHRAPINK